MRRIKMRNTIAWAIAAIFLTIAALFGNGEGFSEEFRTKNDPELIKVDIPKIPPIDEAFPSKVKSS